MNTQLFLQNTTVNIPQITPLVLSYIRVTFDSLRNGDFFLLPSKKRNQVMMKTGTKSAILMLDNDGKMGQVDKIARDTKVISLDSEINIEVSRFTQYGAELNERQVKENDKLRALRPQGKTMGNAERVAAAHLAIEALGELGFETVVGRHTPGQVHNYD